MSEEKFYRCIPELNKECKKNNCYINGGECETTIYKKYTLKGLLEEIERLNKCIDEALEIIIKDWNDKCTIPIHSVVDTGGDIRIKLYYQLFLKGVDKE